MNFVVDDAIFEAFPDVAIGLVVARGVTNRTDAEAREALAQRLAEAQDGLRAALGAVSLTEHHRIRCWREAYRHFGAKPKKYPSSIESLARRALKGERLAPINKLVDLYNVISMKHLLPAGGEDLDRIEGGIRLTFATPDEPAVQLLGESEARPPKPGEIIYRDDRSAICRRWNWKEAERTKLTEETRSAVLVLEALPPVSRGRLEAAAEELRAMLGEHCGGHHTVAVVDRDERTRPL